ncbi:unnamed protein product [Sphagnum troendelagicum]
MFYRMIFSLFAPNPVQARDADASARRCDCGKRKESFAPLCCKRGLCCKEALCQRYGGPGRIVQANAEASPVCGSLVDGFVAGAAAVLSRAMVFLAVVSEALVRAARVFGETLTAMKLPEVTTLEERKLVAALKGRVLIAAAPLFFAAISQPGSVSTPLTVVASGMAKWLELYSGVLMVRVLLSWFPNIPWERQPLQAVRDMNWKI